MLLAQLVAQASEAIDAAGRIETLGIVGVVALVAIVLAALAWWLKKQSDAANNRIIESLEADKTRLLAERNAAQKKVENLHAYIDDIVLPAVGAANSAVSRSMRRVVDEG